MKTKRLNGLQLEEMLRSGLNNLRQSEQEINDLNVFPVPDGDTGTNMRLTLEHGMQKSRSTTEVGAYLKQLSDGMLLGARGNSGVILSQIFRGIYQELSRAGSVSAADLRNGFIRGYRTAYSAVARPVEGTILTVSREGIENIRSQVGRSTFVEDMLGMYVAEMRKSLAHTPDMLPVLKEAGVIDSGAAGFILIVDGMLKCLYGEAVQESASSMSREKAEEPKTEASAALFDENSAFEDGYCVEFILQRMRGDGYRQDFSVRKFTEALEKIGNSIVVVENDRIVKVHVHTMKPSKVFRLAENFGEFVSVKVDNMQIQHNEHVRKNEPEPEPEPKVIRKEFCIVTVANSPEMAELFTSLGADAVVEGGRTMNTSSEAFLTAFSRLDAGTIVVLPNNKNIIPAAEQAAKMVSGKNVNVLPSKSVAEGYFALAMDVPGNPDGAFRIASMEKGIERVTTLEIAKATRSYTADDVSAEEGKTVAIVDRVVKASCDSVKDAVLSGIEAVEDADDKETCVVFLGENGAEALSSEDGEDPADLLSEWITERYPMMEVTVLQGGQPIYDLTFGIV